MVCISAFTSLGKHDPLVTSDALSDHVHIGTRLLAEPRHRVHEAIVQYPDHNRASGLGRRT